MKCGRTGLSSVVQISGVMMCGLCAPVLYPKGFDYAAETADLRSRLAAAERERDEARATVAGMREAVLEFELRPPEGEFVSLKDGAVYYTRPDRIAGYFEALDHRWKSADVVRWSEQFRTARDRADAERYCASEVVQAARAVLESIFCRTGMGDPMVKSEPFERLRAAISRYDSGDDPSCKGEDHACCEKHKCRDPRG